MYVAVIGISTLKIQNLISFTKEICKWQRKRSTKYQAHALRYYISYRFLILSSSSHFPHYYDNNRNSDGGEVSLCIINGLPWLLIFNTSPESSILITMY